MSRIVTATLAAALLLATAGEASAKCSAAVESAKSYKPEYVYFPSGSAQLAEAERAKIAKQAQLAKDNYIQRLCLRGKADKQGDAAANEKLAKARAAAVAAELVKHGITRQMIETDAVGEPGGTLFSNVERGARADRRVEIRFTK